MVCFFKEGKLHREDGPAYIKRSADGNIIYEEYHFNGVEYKDKDIIDNWEFFCKTFYKLQVFR